MKRKEEVQKIDNRKIPEFFRAIERTSNSPDTYYGVLVSDDGYNFVTFAATDSYSVTNFKERVLQKKDFNFSKISKSDFELHARRGVHNMGREAADQLLEFEATKHKHEYAQQKLSELLGVVYE